MSGSNGRRTTTPPIRPASRGSGAASTSRPTTSRAGSWGRSAARKPGHSPSGSMRARFHRDDAGRRRMTRGRLGAVTILLVAVLVVAAAAVRLRAPGPGAVLGAPRFVNETASAGVTTTYGGDPAYATGGGVATFDCSGDGRPDLLVAGGGNPAALYRNTSPVGGELRFAAVTTTQVPALGPGVTG